MRRFLILLVGLVAALALSACADGMGFGEHHRDPAASVVVNISPVNNAGAHEGGASDSWASGDTSEGARSGTNTPTATTSTEATATVPAAPPGAP